VSFKSVRCVNYELLNEQFVAYISSMPRTEDLDFSLN